MAESVQEIPPFVNIPAPTRPAVRPTTREWLRHIALFLLTVVTTTFAGIFALAPEIDISEPPLAEAIDYILFIPRFYLEAVLGILFFAFQHPRLLVDGLTFSAALLAILTAHEMGHYVACRRYRVNATLPFFIPAPPLFLAGTFGAFIKIKSPIPSRRALFDIGLAGPLAGFVVALPLSVVGVLTVGTSVPPPEHAILFIVPLLFRLIAKVF